MKYCYVIRLFRGFRVSEHRYPTMEAARAALEFFEELQKENPKRFRMLELSREAI